MTRDDIRAEVDAAVDEFAQLVAGQEQESTGVRPAPSIMESVTELELQPFDIGLEQESSAQALEGGGGIVGGAIGACCYDDGTCDNLTEIDCPGNWQGAGTNCSTEGICLGACCYSDGSCYDNMTKADCENATGVFQDFQSDCGPPNPCIPPCTCSPTYSAFDGSGRQFRTKTTTTNGTMHADNPPHYVIDITYNATKTEDSCSGSCSCAGSGSSTCTGPDCGGPGCSATANVCGGTGVSGCVFSGEAGGCGPPIDQGQQLPGSCPPPSVSMSATSMTSHYSCVISFTTYDATVVTTLSNECIPV